MRKTVSGFTIVELLIVIIVIAILAAISVVAYNGIQTRANNNSIIYAASQSVKIISGYTAQEGVYPATNTYACITTQSGCVETDGTVRAANSSFDTNIVRVGSVPRNTPNVSTVGHGLTYNHSDSRQFNGQPRRALLMYFLNGQSQNCGISNVMSAWGTPGQEAVPSTTGFTFNSASTNKTVCFVSLP